MFSNHSDKFDLPHGAKNFARGIHCENHGISYGKAHGLQFHPNSEAETISKIAEEPVKRFYAGVQSAAEIKAGLKHLEAQQAWLKDFCTRLHLSI